MKLNTIYNEDCLVGMKKIPSKSIDLIITSPPYDKLRNYNSVFDFDTLAKEMKRVLKEGGVCVWNVNDQVVNGNKTLTSFRQAIRFQELGFNVNDVMIWRKTNPMPEVEQYCSKILQPNSQKKENITSKEAGSFFRGYYEIMEIGEN